MDPNFDRLRRRFENVPGSRGFNNFRRQFYRSSNGKLLGVFSGIAESRGYCVRRVRWIGLAVLLFLAVSVADTHGLKATVIVCGFYYLVLALLMQSPRVGFSGSTVPPPVPRSPPPVPGGSFRGGPRPDLAALDRTLDSLNRRIQRMETIVTDRQYDWDRRMGS